MPSFGLKRIKLLFPALDSAVSRYVTNPHNDLYFLKKLHAKIGCKNAKKLKMRKNNSSCKNKGEKIQ